MRTTTIAQLPLIARPVFTILENDSDNVLSCICTALTNLRLLLLEKNNIVPDEDPLEFLTRMTKHFADLNRSNPAEIISFLESEEVFDSKNNKGFQISESKNALVTIHEELTANNTILLCLDAPLSHPKDSEHYVGHLCCLHIEDNYLCVDSLHISWGLLARMVFSNPNNFALIFSTKKEK